MKVYALCVCAFRVLAIYLCGKVAHNWHSNHTYILQDLFSYDLTGVWEDDRQRSDSLEPFLKGLGLNYLVHQP